MLAGTLRSSHKRFIVIVWYWYGPGAAPVSSRQYVTVPGAKESLTEIGLSRNPKSPSHASQFCVIKYVPGSSLTARYPPFLRPPTLLPSIAMLAVRADGALVRSVHVDQCASVSHRRLAIALKSGAHSSTPCQARRHHRQHQPSFAQVHGFILRHCESRALHAPSGNVILIDDARCYQPEPWHGSRLKIAAKRGGRIPAPSPIT